MSEQREIYRTATTTGLPSKKIEVFITGAPGRISFVQVRAVQCIKCANFEVIQLVDESQSFAEIITSLGWALANIHAENCRSWMCPKCVSALCDQK